MLAAHDDCWEAFGSEDEDDEAVVANRQDVQAIALHVSQSLLKHNAQVKLAERVVFVAEADSATTTALQQRGIKNVLTDVDEARPPIDAIVCLYKSIAPERLGDLLPGGILVTDRSSVPVSVSDFDEPTIIHDSQEIKITSRVKKLIHVHSKTCPWLPVNFCLSSEAERLQNATVPLSSLEISRGHLNELSIERAVQRMNDYGYCVIRNILDQSVCKAWAAAVLDTVHSAAKILMERDQVDIFNPQKSIFEPQSYRELSMREDLRLDLRRGPQLATLRSRETSGNEPLIVSSTTKEFQGFLRGHHSLLEIVRLVMNPKKDDLYPGNVGRYNFGGTGPDGSFQDLRVSPVGGIVSFPGAGDQALHADTPHLFEHLPQLPAHYINIFAPGTPFDDEVGGTAFIHGSHSLDFTSKYYGSDGTNSKVYPYLVRPCLTIGDAVLFDCRVLHFGLANTSKSVERVMLYTNTTHAWFHDPKNWDNRRPIFKDSNPIHEK